MNTAKEFILNYAGYNVWANKRIASVLDQLSDAQLDQILSSSFPSIRKTVYHVWDAEYIWLHRLQGKSLAFGYTKTLPEGTPASAFASQAELFLEFLLQQNDSFFTAQTTYTNIKGDPFVSLNSEMIMHCMNHSTFHRGQIITMIRETGWKDALPSTDMIGYFRELGIGK